MIGRQADIEFGTQWAPAHAATALMKAAAARSFQNFLKSPGVFVLPKIKGPSWRAVQINIGDVPGSLGPDKEGTQQVLAWHQDQFRTAAVSQVIEILCYLCESFTFQSHLGVPRASVPASMNVGQDMQRMHLPVDAQSANAGAAPVAAASAGHLLSLAAGATHRPYYSFQHLICICPSHRYRPVLRKSLHVN